MSSNRFEGLPIKVIGGLAALGVAVIAYKMSTTPRNRPASPLTERLENTQLKEEKKEEEKPKEPTSPVK
jgi:hypothetical protein